MSHAHPELPPVERRHKARRASDILPPDHSWLVTLVLRNPVTVGMSIALLVATVALVLVLGALHGLGNQQNDMRAFAAASARQRQSTVRSFCDAINQNAAAVNKETDFLIVILVSGVKESRPFESTFRHFGFPPYAARLKQAEQTAQQLARRKVPILDCQRFTDRIAKKP